MQESDDKKLSDLSKRFLQAISYCGLSGYKLKKDNIISSESTLTSIKKGIQLPSKKTIDAFCEKYDVSRAWLYTGEGLFAKTPSGQIEPSEKDIRDALKNARMQSDSTISKVAPFLDNVLTLKADNPKHGQLDVERREIRGMWQALRIISQKII